MSRPLSTFSLRRIVAGVAAAGVMMSLVSAAHAYIFGNSGVRGSVILSLNSSLIMPYKQSGYGAFGNYSNTGVDTPYNYFAEQSTPSDQLSYNDYFVFNLTGITAPITSATLTLFSYDDTTNNSFRVGGYTGSIKKLLDGTGGTTAYTALGSGKLYGLQTFTVADSNHYVTFNLNAAFIKAINKAIEAGDKEFVLGGSAGTATPEPATWALMMVGLGGVGAAMRRARRRVGEARA